MTDVASELQALVEKRNDAKRTADEVYNSATAHARMIHLGMIEQAETDYLAGLMDIEKRYLFPAPDATKLPDPLDDATDLGDK